MTLGISNEFNPEIDDPSQDQEGSNGQDREAGQSTGSKRPQGSEINPRPSKIPKAIASSKAQEDFTRHHIRN